MKYRVTLKRVTTEFYTETVEAYDSRDAIKRVRKEAKRLKEDGEDPFCDGLEGNTIVHRVKQEDEQ